MPDGWGVTPVRTAGRRRGLLLGGAGLSPPEARPAEADPAPTSPPPGTRQKPAGGRPKPKATPDEPPPPPAIPYKDGPPVAVSAGRLARDYAYREADADARYKGAVVRVTGRYTFTVATGDRLLIIPAKPFGKIEFDLNPNGQADQQNLREGQTVCVEGQCLGLVGPREAGEAARREAPVVLRDCRFLLMLSPDGSEVKATPGVRPAAPRDVTARQLASGYADDPAVADLAYKGQSFRTAGVVWEVEPGDGKGVLEAGTGVRRVRCAFGSDARGRLAAVKPGQAETVRGTCAGPWATP